MNAEVHAIRRHPIAFRESELDARNCVVHSPRVGRVRTPAICPSRRTSSVTSVFQRNSMRSRFRASRIIGNTALTAPPAVK